MSKNEIYRFYEGITDSNNFVKDLALVLATGVRTEPIVDSEDVIVDGITVKKEVVLKKSLPIKEKNFDIVYPTVKPAELPEVLSWTDLSSEEYLLKTMNQVNKISNTVILKMTTTPKIISETSTANQIIIDLETNKESASIYVEIYKPTYIIDTEKFNPNCERDGIRPYTSTLEMYSELYAGNQDNIIDILSEDTGSITVIPSDDRIRFRTFTYNKTKYDSNLKAYTFSNETIVFFNELKKSFNIDISVGIAGVYKVSKSSISSAKNTDAMKWLIYFSGKSYEDLCKYNYIRFETTDSGADYYLNIESHDIYSSYEIPENWNYSLPNPKDVIEETVSVFIGDVELKKDIDYEFVASSGTITILNKISGQDRVIGFPTIRYSITKFTTDVTGKRLLLNNHYVFIRLFDNIKEDMSGPLDNIEDEITGEISLFNSHVSEWSKLSWYQDFEEVLISSLNNTIHTGNCTDGLINVPIETHGLNGETKIKFWINTNNDRAVFGVMGNPSLDFRPNRHLISCSYIGQIESFYDSCNDTVGNFALFTSSSTTPCYTKNYSKTTTTYKDLILGTGPEDKFSIDLTGNEQFDLYGNYNITKDSVTLDPSEYNLSFSNENQKLEIELILVPDADTSIAINYPIKIKKVYTIDGITRSEDGDISKIIYSDRFGKYTATGVLDVSMYHTKYKVYFQKHHMLFATAEEYLSKNLYGKSAYTDEYYADRIKITHGVDGPRGMLFDCLAVESSSLLAFDDLIVNKNFEKDRTKPQETYIFFPITAQYSPFSNSPNATYGLAIKRKTEWVYPETNEEFINDASIHLEAQMGSLLGLKNDIILPAKQGEHVTITWTSSDDTLIEISEVLI